MTVFFFFSSTNSVALTLKVAKNKFHKARASNALLHVFSPAVSPFTEGAMLFGTWVCLHSD